MQPAETPVATSKAVRQHSAARYGPFCEQVFDLFDSITYADACNARVVLLQMHSTSAAYSMRKTPSPFQLTLTEGSLAAETRFADMLPAATE